VSKPCPAKYFAHLLANRPAVPVTGEVAVSLSRQQGALLAFFDEALHENMFMKAKYKRLFIECHEYWLAYAKQADLDLCMEDLILVTGTSRARSWANAVFDDAQANGNVTLKVNLQNLGGINMTCGLRWENTHGVQCNWGPLPLPATMNSLDIDMFQSTALPPSRGPAIPAAMVASSSEAVFFRATHLES
jgi:hypothetical protein